MAFQELNQISPDDVIPIQLGELASGTYFVSLLSKSEVLDIEKFMVKL